MYLTNNDQVMMKRSREQGYNLDKTVQQPGSRQKELKHFLSLKKSDNN